jgi:ParB-like chromosome segregation protein Spo0J
MMKVKNEKELAKLGFKLDPNNPTQVVPLNQPTDTVPDDKVRNYHIFPDLSPKEEEVLRTSIKKVGVLDPIVKDEDGNTIDGHQRQRIAGELGVPCPEVVRHFESEQEKFEYALNCNRARRRNLNQQQKRHVIADYLMGDPEISNNWLAEILGVSDTTVIDVRKELESTSQIGKLKKLRSKDGKKHPAKKTTNTAPKKKAKTKLKLAEIEPNEDEPDDEDDEYKPEPATDEDKRESANIFICNFGTNPEAWADDSYTGPEPEAIPKAVTYLIENFFPGGWDAARKWMATQGQDDADPPAATHAQETFNETFKEV